MNDNPQKVINDKINEVISKARTERIPAMLDEGMEILLQTVKDLCPHAILEIGTAIGYSAMAMLQVAPNDCYIDTIEIDEKRYSEAIINFCDANVADKINCYLGDCLEVLPKIIADKKYDLVFIDAAKSKYLDCLKAVEEHLNDGGAVVADNVYFRGMVLSGEEPPRKYRTIVKNLRKFIEYISDNNKFATSIHDKGDGVAVIKKMIID